MKFPSVKTPESWKQDTPEAKKKEARKRVLIIVGLTFLLLLIYFSVNALVDQGVLARGWGFAVMIVYMVSFAGLLVGYLIYNRAFINKNVTVDMLPDDWSDEKKQAFVDDNKARQDKSRWLLYLLIPFIFVFLAEAMYLFVWVDNLEHYFM
ncbi:MAG: hypothetical protein MJ192_01655 [Clostridia bacterium]|nr:hypothetical protein [Clostridia bacterium]